MPKKEKYFQTQKEVKKTWQNSVMESFASAVTALGASFGIKAIGDKIPENARKLVGASTFALGTGLNVYAKHSLIKGASNGLSAFGAIQAVNDLGSPTMKAKFATGLAGTATDSENEAIQDYDLEQLAVEASEEIDANINGIEEDVAETMAVEDVTEDLKGVQDEIDNIIN